MRIVLVAVALAGCRPAVTLRYMRPAEVTLPPEVRTVAIVDRPQTEESAVAAQALRKALEGSPRLDVANPAAVQEAVGRVRIAVGAPFDADSTSRLCAESGATGIVALEWARVGGDWRVEEWTETVTETVTERPADCDDCTEVEKEIEREEPRVRATWDGGAGASWDVLACDGARLTAKEVAFTEAWSGEGPDLSIAKANAGDPRAHGLELAEATGAAFADHVSPHEVSVSRRYFRAGHAELAAGHRAVRAGDWDEAARHWEKAAKDGDPTVRGKALYDLALAAEQRGELEEAHQRARRARDLLDGGPDFVGEYVSVLKKRRLLAKKLDEQMRGAGDADALHVRP